jgi:hypothetical protein
VDCLESLPVGKAEAGSAGGQPAKEWPIGKLIAVVVLFTLRGPLETETPIVAAIVVFHSSPRRL